MGSQNVVFRLERFISLEIQEKPLSKGPFTPSVSVNAATTL